MLTHDQHSSERGSALLTVLVVMLVLTVVVFAAIITTEEDRDTAYSEVFANEALYAAEVGLRRGERALDVFPDPWNILEHTAVAQTPANKSANDDFIPDHPLLGTEFDLDHLGTYVTEAGVELANIEVPRGNVGAAAVARYSLFVRNNPDDPYFSTDPTVNTDTKVRLISVGWIERGNQIAAVKVLEEEYAYPASTMGSAARDTQYLKDSSGTSSIRFGASS